jgi:uncharacterized membrane protein
MKLSRSQLILIAFFALGVYFRLSGLGNMIYSHDEAYTALRAAGYTGSEAIDTIWTGKEITRDDIQFFLRPNANKTAFDTLSVVAKSEPQLSPLYFLFAHYWMRIIGSSASAMRGLSALLSLFAIPGIYWLSLELFKSRKTALVSAVLISLSPFSILYAQDARPYSIWASLTLLSSAAFLAALRKNSKSAWVVYGLSVIVGLYSHQLFALVGMAHGLYLILVKEARQERSFSRYLIASSVAFLVFIPWFVQMFFHWDNMIARISWSNTEFPLSLYIQRWVMIFASPFIDLYFDQGNILPYILRLPVLILIGYALYFLVVSSPKPVWAFLLLLLGVTALPLFLSDLSRGGILSIQGRYLVSTNVLTLSVVSHLVVEKISSPGEKISHRRWYMITALLLVAQLGSAVNILLSETWWTKKLTLNDPQVAHVLNKDIRPLLIVYGLAPTDLGDILALSYSVDEDVQFKLYQEPAVVEPPIGFSNIYWYHRNYHDFTDSHSERQYRAKEVVPLLLWRLDS